MRTEENYIINGELHTVTTEHRALSFAEFSKCRFEEHKFLDYSAKIDCNLDVESNYILYGYDWYIGSSVVRCAFRKITLNN